jgi:hypothetical protein
MGINPLNGLSGTDPVLEDRGMFHVRSVAEQADQFENWIREAAGSDVRMCNL